MFSLSTTELWRSVAGLLFPLCPLIMLMPLIANNRHRRFSPTLLQFLVIWVFLTLVRASLLFYPEMVASFLVPAPLSTTLFFLVGLLLLAMVVFPSIAARRRLWRTAGKAQMAGDLMALSPRAFEEMVVELYTATWAGRSCATSTVWCIMRR